MMTRGRKSRMSLHLPLGHAAADRHDGRAEPLDAVVRAEAAGEEAVAVRDVDDVTRVAAGQRIDQAMRSAHVSMSSFV